MTELATDRPLIRRLRAARYNELFMLIGDTLCHKTTVRNGRCHPPPSEELLRAILKLKGSPPPVSGFAFKRDHTYGQPVRIDRKGSDGKPRVYVPGEGNVDAAPIKLAVKIGKMPEGGIAHYDSPLDPSLSNITTPAYLAVFEELNAERLRPGRGTREYPPAIFAILFARRSGRPELGIEL